MKRLLRFLLCFLALPLVGQDYYYPPSNTDEWEEVSVSDLSWDAAYLPTLAQFLEQSDTKAFLILHRGRIVLESYYNGHGQDSVWYWASAGKALTAVEIGMLQEEGLVDIHQATSTYLGQGWTSCDADQEGQIDIWHQLTMTTGLDYRQGQLNCTAPSCLQCLNPVGTAWYYHNAPYTLLSDVIEEVTGRTRTLHTNLTLGQQIGLRGLWVNNGDNRVFFSRARSMARFGLLVASNGLWDESVVVTDDGFLADMKSPSQPINPSYGYLWWLNTGPTFRLPGSTLDFPGQILPDAPPSVYAAIGKNSQILLIDPTEDLVIVRMGNSPDTSAVSITFLRELWGHLLRLRRSPTNTSSVVSPASPIPYPNPVCDWLQLPEAEEEIVITNMRGETVYLGRERQLDVRRWPNGSYVITIPYIQGRESILIHKVDCR